MQKTELKVENICPECGASFCAQFLSVDGKEIHINCLDCNRVYAGKVPAGQGDLKVITQWREVGSFVRL